MPNKICPIRKIVHAIGINFILSDKADNNSSWSACCTFRNIAGTFTKITVAIVNIKCIVNNVQFILSTRFNNSQYPIVKSNRTIIKINPQIK